MKYFHIVVLCYVAAEYALLSLIHIQMCIRDRKNWIGKSTGAEVDFAVKGKDEKLTVYTTRPDTLFGVTYMVISPEHPMIDKYKDCLLYTSPGKEMICGQK